MAAQRSVGSDLYTLENKVDYKDVTFTFNGNIYNALSFYNDNPTHLHFGTVMFDSTNNKYFFIDRQTIVDGKKVNNITDHTNNKTAMFNGSVSKAIEYYNKNIFELEPNTYVLSSRRQEYYLIYKKYHFDVKQVKQPYTKSMDKIIEIIEHGRKYTVGQNISHMSPCPVLSHKSDTQHINQTGQGRKHKKYTIKNKKKRTKKHKKKQTKKHKK
jgi:asparagine synthetase B (glutamine-hydrolysing)